MTRNVLLLVGAIFFAGACAPSDIVISGTGSRGLPYDPSFVRYMMGQGDIPLEIHGNPSPLDSARFVALVEQRLKVDPAFGVASFRTEPNQRAAHGFRVVLVFNADNTRMDPRAICRGEGLAKSGGSNIVLHVSGAFCDREDVLSSNTALANTPDDFGGPLFSRVLDNLLIEMMPAEGNRDVDESCPPPANCS